MSVRYGVIVRRGVSVRYGVGVRRGVSVRDGVGVRHGVSVRDGVVVRRGVKLRYGVKVGLQYDVSLTCFTPRHWIRSFVYSNVNITSIST